MDLVELVFAWEEWFFCDEFKQHTAESPNVHFLVVVAISHQTLGSSVPTSRDVVSVRKRRVLALAGSKIGKFDQIPLDQDVLRLDISVKDTFAMHELDGSEYLEHVELDFLEGERVFLIFETLVHVHIH